MVKLLVFRFSVRSLLLAGLMSFCFGSMAQVIPLGTAEEINTRSLQLMGKLDASVSFAVRPMMSYSTISSFLSDTGLISTYPKRSSFAKNKGTFVLLPLQLTQQLNTHHPYGWNDGAMIAARGYQMLASGGAYASLGPVELQLKPEFVYASNSSYEYSNAYGSPTNGGYVKLFPGQSAITVSTGKVSLGVSTANMWWGPGMRSSLLMSNNAPGFPYLFFRTRKPVRTPIGSFEWQLTSGWLSHSKKELPFENNHLLIKTPSHPDDTRYLNGLVLSYHPKWVPGLFVGFTRSVQSYTNDNLALAVGAFEKYLPVLALAVQKKGARSEDSASRDQLASFFLRWIFPKAGFEFYVEYGFNDYGQNTRDYLLSPSHSAAYIAGARKIIEKERNKRIEFGLELAQMTQSPDWVVRNAGNWYTHGQVWEGYTNQNQILGAGAGFGANVLSIDATWINGSKRLGFLVERIQRDPLERPADWTDFGIGVLPQVSYKQYILSGILELIQSKNYLWQKGNDRFNVHARLSVQYNF